MMDHSVSRLPAFVPENGMPPPTNSNTAERLTQIDQLKYFLATATENWPENTNIKRFRLPNGEDISCVYWNDLFYITGTDIVRSLTFRFHAFGRPVTNAKKFEEGIFSDLRNLKPGTDARLEEPKSELLDMLYKHNCIRTQKKQKVFCWYAVPHDRLFLDALERDLKREKMNTEPTTTAVAEPASSLSLDSTQELFDQLRKSMSLTAVATAHALEDEGLRSIMPPVSNSGNWGDSLAQQRSRLAEKAKQAARRSRVNSVPATIGHQQQLQVAATRHHYHHLSHAGHTTPAAATPRARSRLRAASAASVVPSATSKRLESARLSSPHASFAKSGESITRHRTSTSTGSVSSTKSLDPTALKKTKTIFGSLSLFDGSPMYKQRRRRAASASSTPVIHGAPQQQDHAVPERVRRHHNCHLHNTNTTTLPNAPSFRGPSRLAMAAVDAGFNSGNVPIKNEVVPVSNCTSTSSEMTWVEKQHQQQQPSPQQEGQQQQQEQQQQQQQLEAERTYKCPQPSCSQVFRRVEHLDLHLRAHAVEEPFMCSMCGKRFASSDLLTCHHQEMHEMFMYDDKQPVQPHLPQHQPQQQADIQRQQPHSSLLSHDCATTTTTATSCAQTPPNCSSRGSSLSPVLDLDGFVHPPPPIPPSTTMDPGMVLSLPTSQVMPPRLQMTSMDEDNCSSLTSSPSSIVHFGQFFQQPPPGPPHHEYDLSFATERTDHPATTATSISTPFTLLSPFKPDQIHPCDQPMYPVIDHDLQTALCHPPPLSAADFNCFDVPMQDSYGYAEPVPFQYTPFVAPNDVSASMI